MEGTLLHFNDSQESTLKPDLRVQVLDSPVLPSATSGGMPFYHFRNKLRKLSLKHADKYNILPTTLFLRGVERPDNKQYGAGAFSNVYCGTYGGVKVALKQLRVYVMSPESEKQSVKRVRSRFYDRCSLLMMCIFRHSIGNLFCGRLS